MGGMIMGRRPRVSGRAAPEPAAASAPLHQPPLVAFLSAQHPPEDLRVVGKQGAALVAAGWRVTHLAPLVEPLAGAQARLWRNAGGVDIHAYPAARRRIARLPALYRHALASGATVLHANEPDSWAVALLAGWRLRARVVLDVHEHYPSRLDTRLPRPLRPLARGALRLACRVMGRGADAVVVAKGGLAADFGPRVAPRIIAVRNYGLPVPVVARRHAEGGWAPLLAHSGALSRARGAMEMLEALPLCPPGTQLRLIGQWTDGSAGQFQALAEQLGVARWIEHYPWRPHAEALRLLSGADIGLVLFQPGVENHRLALPHKLFDCMLAGLPVIAPAFATEVAAVVRAADCGILVDTADPFAIAAAVARLADPALRARLGRQGREAALSRFSWAAEAARLVALYESLAPRMPDVRGSDARGSDARGSGARGSESAGTGGGRSAVALVAPPSGAMAGAEASPAERTATPKLPQGEAKGVHCLPSAATPGGGVAAQDAGMVPARGL